MFTIVTPSFLHSFFSHSLIGSFFEKEGKVSFIRTCLLSHPLELGRRNLIWTLSTNTHGYRCVLYRSWDSSIQSPSFTHGKHLTRKNTAFGDLKFMQLLFECNNWHVWAHIFPLLIWVVSLIYCAPLLNISDQPSIDVAEQLRVNDLSKSLHYNVWRGSSLVDSSPFIRSVVYMG